MSKPPCLSCSDVLHYRTLREVSGYECDTCGYWEKEKEVPVESFMRENYPEIFDTPYEDSVSRDQQAYALQAVTPDLL